LTVSGQFLTFTASSTIATGHYRSRIRSKNIGQSNVKAH